MPKKKRKFDPSMKRLDKLAKIIESYGWRVIVVGPARIEKRSSPKFKYTFSVDFLGGKKGGEIDGL
jgi:hypothetical protein